MKNLPPKLLIAGFLVLAIVVVSSSFIINAPNPNDQLAAPGGIPGAPDDLDIIQPLGPDTLVREGKPIKVHPSHVLVKFKPGAARNFHAQSSPAQQFKGDRDLYLVENPSGRSVETMLNFYSKNPNVEYVEPDYIYELTAIPNDPLWSQQWDMVKLQAPQAWDTQTDASNVVVGIMDSGINFSHPDLQANLWTNPTDGSHGYDCVAQHPGGEDQNGHGTWMAGIIGATGNNGAGMAGLNWKVKLLSLKIGSGSFVSSSGVIRCLDYATNLKRSGVNLRVINESFGGSTLSLSVYDAFRRSAEAGIMHVAAAGNESRNTDIIPFYPASFSGAYNIPGLISVMATDQNDKKWSYSDWGLATVDLGASSGAVSTTVFGQVTDCEFCNPSGYYPSAGGTSAATPHVAGVAVALFTKNPALTPAQARDIILDYASYDPASDPLAQQSTTGGRLNFHKVLQNPLVDLPRLNNMVALTANNVMATANSATRLSATVSDPDNDQVRLTLFQTDNGPFSCMARSWLLGEELSKLFPSTLENNGMFTAPTLAMPAVVNYVMSATDNRGGGVSVKPFITVTPGAAPGLPPAGTLSVTPTVGPAGSEIISSFSGSDPEGGPVLWSLSYGWPYGTSDLSKCCFQSGEVLNNKLSSSGVYRLRAYAIDRELNIIDSNSAVVRIGGAIGEPPVAEMTPDKISGPAPLTVTFDTNGSYDPDGSITNRVLNCYPYHPTIPNSNKFACTFTEPGPYRVYLSVKDNHGYSDLREQYITVLPSPITNDNEPPIVNITAPLSRAVVSGKYYVNINASDNVWVVKKELYIDGEYYGTAPGYWETIKFNNGPHTLTVKSYDQAGNVGVSVPVTVSVNNIVVISSPVADETKPVSGIVPINVQTAETIIGVQIKIDGTNLGGEDMAPPFSISWNTGEFSDGTHNLIAIGRNSANSLTTSAAVSIKIDNTPPTVRIENPIVGTTVSGATPITVSYGATDGIVKLLTYVDTAPIGNLTVSPLSNNPVTYSWDTLRYSNGPHTVVARALDWAGHITNAQITVMVNNLTNLPPTTNAGADQTITLPNTATLTGTATDDGLPNPPGTLTITWSKVSAPGTVTFNNPTALSTTATFSLAGTYTLRLTANDGALTTTDDVIVTANPVVVATTYTITTTATTGGTITPNGAISVTQGGNQTFRIVPNSGYQIASVFVDGINQGAITTYTFSNVQANHTISASFSQIPIVNKPTPPSNFTAVAVSPTQVNLTWTDNADNETGFRLWRSTAGATYVQIASPVADTISYPDTNVSPSTVYQYAIQTFNTAGGSAFVYANVTTPAE
ncbi:MAG: S8 family serine peptidase [Candidatus Vogelbacteria bacterium]